MMKIDTNKQEYISALLDGELPSQECEMALAEAAHGGKQAWEMYHQIGDVLRSDELAVKLSVDFSARFAALLDAEPVILAPKPRPLAEPPEMPAVAVNGALLKSRFSWNVAIASMAAAAAVAFVMVPQITSMFGNTPNGGLQLAKVNDHAGRSPAQQHDAVQLVADAGVSESQSRPADEPEMLRDPRIDSYLLAHQRFSPAISNAAQTTHYAARATSSASDK
ncbi:sigma-E factor negative regulatory protein [Undibacterium sp.]|uniref:sigma-E factor negative regulatory protein n=1 Tax=Undibacterium sp. TaxID=1914977 RepID=UPI002BBAF17D|nr:sigma-E factor negative regulatory protein [Undibacterium sp.]HTD05506.1 sigma-E factor negative regulatory protein [Undibacterium sp.]